MLSQPAYRKRPAKRETSLYVPVKRFLESLGFAVKGEICGCDLVAIRGEEPPLIVIGELKLGFNLELVLQGINRSAACDQVWLAVRVSGRRGRAHDPRVRKLCRLLGFGLLAVSAAGRVEVPFEYIAPAAGRWWTSDTRQGIQVALGRAGSRSTAPACAR